MISSVWSRLYAPIIRTAYLGKVRDKNTAWSMCELSGFNPFTAMLAVPSFWKQPHTKSAKFEIPLRMSTWKVFPLKWIVLKVDLLSDLQIYCFVGVYVCTFQPGNFTGRDSEGVKVVHFIRCFARNFHHNARIANYSTGINKLAGIFFFKSQVNGQVIGRASGVPRETPRQPVRTWRDLLERTASTVCGWGWTSIRQFWWLARLAATERADWL